MTSPTAKAVAIVALLALGGCGDRIAIQGDPADWHWTVEEQTRHSYMQACLVRHYRYAECALMWQWLVKVEDFR